jgi:G3E family GTPase
MNAFVYKAQRPFAPDRLWKVASSSISHLKAVVRAKGLVWLVSRPDRWGYWSQNPQSIEISGISLFTLPVCASTALIVLLHAGGDSWSIASGKDKRQEILFVGTSQRVLVSTHTTALTNAVIHEHAQEGKT